MCYLKQDLFAAGINMPEKMLLRQKEKRLAAPLMLWIKKQKNLKRNIEKNFNLCGA
jgi:hypothetical protein